MENFVVEGLSRSAILNAYPLVHLAVPKLDLPAWRRFVQLSLDRRRGALSGILVARRAARRHICGLVCYRCEPDMMLGRVLQARNLIAIDILDTQSIILALLSNLRALARANGCSTIHFMMPDTEFAAALLPDLITRLGRRSTFNRWVDVSFSTNDSLSCPPNEVLH